VVATSPTSLPKYLFKRGHTFYFKRKIPTDVADGFPEFREQVWRSLGTCLLAKARVLLAVEVTEFDLKVAEMRRGQAVNRATDCGAEHSGPVAAPPCGASVLVANPVRAPAPSSIVGRANPAPRTVASALEASPQPAPSRTVRPVRSVATTLPAATASTQAKATGPNRPSMLHLFEDWKQKQTRPRTVNSVHTPVMEFRTLHGAVAVEDLVKAHARAYRPSLARWRDSTIDADKCENVCTAAGSVNSSAGTYTAWIDVMAPLSVLAMRSSNPASSVAIVGWYPRRDGIWPIRLETSMPAWMKRQMLSTSSSTSWCSSSRKYSATHPCLPWPLTFSFGRALQHQALGLWAGADGNRVVAQRALLHRARCNAAATKGAWRPDMEAEGMPA
jgi:hypothetical protein